MPDVGGLKLKKLRESKCLEKNFIFLRLILALSYCLVSESSTAKGTSSVGPQLPISPTLLCYIFIFYYFSYIKGGLLFKIKLKAFLFLTCFEMLIKKTIVPNKISYLD